MATLPAYLLVDIVTLVLLVVGVLIVTVVDVIRVGVLIVIVDKCDTIQTELIFVKSVDLTRICCKCPLCIIQKRISLISHSFLNVQSWYFTSHSTARVILG